MASIGTTGSLEYQPIIDYNWDIFWLGRFAIDGSSISLSQPAYWRQYRLPFGQVTGITEIGHFNSLVRLVYHVSRHLSTGIAFSHCHWVTDAGHQLMSRRFGLPSLAVTGFGH